MKPSLLLPLLLSLPACQQAADSIMKPGRPVAADGPGRASVGVRQQTRRYEYDTLSRGENYVIMGEASAALKDSLQNVWHFVRLRFKPYVRFADFPVAELVKTSVPVRKSDSRPARQFSKAIRETDQKAELNFGGHYCLVHWSCGSDCQLSALMDLKTGIVYEGVEAEAGYDFRSDSRLLIVSPPDSTGFYRDDRVTPHVYVWNETRKKFEER